MGRSGRSWKIGEEKEGKNGVYWNREKEKWKGLEQRKVENKKSGVEWGVLE